MTDEETRWPRISVVIPSFNQVQYIEATLKSVLDQHYPDVELIVIDGGSTDGTVDILKKYAEHLSYWVSEPDDGQTDALIKGFDRSTGEIMCWLCSDDLFELNTLKEVAEVFAEHPDWQVVYGDGIWIDAQSRPIAFKKEIGFNRFIYMYDYNYLPQPSTFWRRDLYKRVGGLDPQMKLAMDGDLWARFAEHTNLHHVPRQWSRMRFYPEQKNQRFRALSDEEDALIQSRYTPDQSPSVRHAKRVAAKVLRVVLKLARGAYR